MSSVLLGITMGPIVTGNDYFLCWEQNTDPIWSTDWTVSPINSERNDMVPVQEVYHSTETCIGYSEIAIYSSRQW